MALTAFAFIHGPTAQDEMVTQGITVDNAIQEMGLQSATPAKNALQVAMTSTASRLNSTSIIHMPTETTTAMEKTTEATDNRRTAEAKVALTFVAPMTATTATAPSISALTPTADAETAELILALKLVAPTTATKAVPMTTQPARTTEVPRTTQTLTTTQTPTTLTMATLTMATAQNRTPTPMATTSRTTQTPICTSTTHVWTQPAAVTLSAAGKKMRGDERGSNSPDVTPEFELVI